MRVGFDVRLAGSRAQPRLIIADIGGLVHAACCQPLSEWLLRHGAIRSDRGFEITSFGGAVAWELAEAGMVEFVAGESGVEEVDHLVEPLVSADDDGRVKVWPRLLGYQAAAGLVPSGARWTGRHWTVPVENMVTRSGRLLPGFDYTDQALQILRPFRSAPEVANSPSEESDGVPVQQSLITGSRPQQLAAQLALSAGLSTLDAVDRHLVEATYGAVPGWFGLALDDYQHAGAIAVVAGHRLLADDMGLGKSRQALAAAAIVASHRTVVITPPVMVTAWARDAQASRLGMSARERFRDSGPEANSAPRNNSDPEPPVPSAYDKTEDEEASIVVVFKAGRKPPSIPAIDETGVVIVPDTVLAARPQLVDELRDWKPDVVLVDEVHRHKTWTAKRSKAVRRLCESAGMSVAISGTPLFASPVEMASPLQITGHLDPVFGGYSRFLRSYAVQNQFRQWVPIRSKMPLLNARLNEEVWVRRLKSQGLIDLPGKTRRVRLLDVDEKTMRSAHRAVTKTIDDWLHGFRKRHGYLPDETEVTAWCQSDRSLGLIAMLARPPGWRKSRSLWT